MYDRIIKPPQNKSFFLFGPRGTGKTTWLKTHYKKAIYLDLLEAELYNDLTGNSQRLENYIPPNFKDWVILDEVQKIPELLNEVHRLIESKKYKFILTGSSARKLRQKGVNLLAGRSLTYHFYPLIAEELKDDFDLKKSLEWGHLPSVFSEEDPKRYLEAYVMTYLHQEVRQEGWTQNLAAFSRFLESASFSQGSLVNMSEMGREVGIDRKVVENYFSILEDMMIGYRLPVFSKKAKRRLIQHSKFYFFDVGIYRILRPKGPFDLPEEIGGMALESLVFQELKAMNDYKNWEYELYFWRTATQLEVDFVLYGNRGIKAIEVKQSQKISHKDLNGLKTFLKDYPGSQAYFIYGGHRKMYQDGIEIIPAENFIKEMANYL